MKRLAITTLVSLLLTTGIVAAWGGPDGTIDTFFQADGIFPYFHDSLALNPDGQGIPDDFVTEKVWTAEGFVQVTQNIDLEDHGGWCGGYADANIDKLIYVDPGQFFFIEFDAHVEKEAVWDGMGEVYRQAWLGDDIYSVVDAGVVYGDGWFIDDIQYKDDVTVYESVGLNRGATCEDPVKPEAPEMPECGWC